jgi:hypothetical protein
MRGERATLSKSLLDVQRELRIKASYIAAIENCDIAAFDTPGFIAGYVRSYARYLGLDPEWAFERFCAESGFVVAHGMSAAAAGPSTQRKKQFDDPLADPNASFVPRGESLLSGVDPRAFGSIAVLVALVGGIGYGGWTVLEEVQRVQLAPVETAPGVLAELDPLASAQPLADRETALASDLVASLPDADRLPDPEALDRLYRPQALDTPVLVPRDGPIAGIDPAKVGALAGAVAENVPATGPEAGLGQPPIQVVAAEAPPLELIAARPAWVKVQAADGTVLFEGTLDSGDRYTVPATGEPPLLRAGESGAVYFAVNGVTYGPAGTSGSVTKDIVLTPDALTSRYVQADLAADEDLARAIAMAAALPAAAAVPAAVPSE